MNLKSPLRPVRNRVPPLWGDAARWAVLAIVLGMASFVGACGFHPLYGTSLEYGGARQIFSTIYVDPIEGERVGYDLRNSLIDNLHGAAKPVDARFRLKVTASQYLQGI